MKLADKMNILDIITQLINDAEEDFDNVDQVFDFLLEIENDEVDALIDIDETLVYSHIENILDI